MKKVDEHTKVGKKNHRVKSTEYPEIEKMLDSMLEAKDKKAKKKIAEEIDYDEDMEPADKGDEYIEDEADIYLGEECPNCGSRDIEGGPIDVEGTGAVQEMKCLDCGSSWEDVYSLDKYVNLKVPESE